MKKRGAFVSAGLVTSLIVGLVLFQVPGRRFFFTPLSAADVAGLCGTATTNNHLLSKFQAALVQSADAANLSSQPVLFSPLQGLVEPRAVASLESPSTVFLSVTIISPVFKERAPPSLI